MKRARGFSLIELMIVIVVIAILVSLMMPALSKAKAKANAVTCLMNLRQWGQATVMYAGENDDYLPPEGTGTSLNSETGWYIALPRTMGLSQTYAQMEWRTNAKVDLPKSLFICPSNKNRSNGKNLFHYCMNLHLDGSGTGDQPTKLGSIPNPAATVYLFDNGKLAARAQQNNVHPNLHSGGAQFAFLDGHAAHFHNREYWDFKQNKGLTNNPKLIWRPWN
jgi:prepilin-type N-terminal cleavage/methylation domain-containing protein/prepilin-type processing-associated H-X9-DG protein